MTQHTFQTEVSQLLQLMIHSLYSQREIFLRELISNANDACDKLRFQALTDSSLTKGDDDFKVHVSADKDAKTVVVNDNGIGMTESEAIDHLGTIAKSGTREFLTQAKEHAGDLGNLIGQFGVGFYSAFMVAEKVVVESRSAHVGADQGIRWSSTGDGQFELETIERPARGTTITLHLTDDTSEFADDWRLKGLIKRYSDYVTYPILMPKPADSGEDDKDEEQKTDQPVEWEQVNAGTALWARPKDEITDEQYKEFYQGACKAWWDSEGPATRIHASVEGTLSFTTLLFIPATKPMDLFDRNQGGLSLYVKRVFIMDDCDELLPDYLRFVRGIVDSDDLPLNVSREILQDNAVVAKLRKQLVKRILDHLTKLSKSEDEAEQQAFITIDEHFGPLLREGIVNDFENKDKLVKLARFPSSWSEAESERHRTGLEAYKERMPEGQDKIYLLAAPNLAAAKSSPHAEAVLKKGFEVLYLVEPVDEWVARDLTTFDDTEVLNITQGEAEQDEEDKKALEEATKEYSDLLGFAKDQFAADIKEVRLTKRLADSPCCIVADQHGMSHHMEEMLRRHGQDIPPQQRILELNPDHALVQKLKELYGDEDRRTEVQNHLHLLRDQALLAEGAQVPDSGAFARRVQDLMSKAI